MQPNAQAKLYEKTSHLLALDMFITPRDHSILKEKLPKNAPMYVFSVMNIVFIDTIIVKKNPIAIIFNTLIISKIIDTFRKE